MNKNLPPQAAQGPMTAPAPDLAACVEGIRTAMCDWAESHPRLAHTLHPVTAPILHLLQMLADLFATLAAIPHTAIPRAAIPRATAPLAMLGHAFPPGPVMPTESPIASPRPGILRRDSGPRARVRTSPPRAHATLALSAPKAGTRTRPIAYQTWPARSSRAMTCQRVLILEICTLDKMPSHAYIVTISK